ncbi:MAG: permease [Chloroflexota bacterium]
MTSFRLRTRHKINQIRQADRVIAVTALLLIGIALLSTAQAIESTLFILDSLYQIGPFLIISVFFAALVRATSADQYLATVFAGNAAVVVVTASLFGALSPFCSCGVIPIVAALLAAGMPLAGIMAFWIASPLMDPEMFFLTTGHISLNFALARTVSAIGMGLLAGFVTLLVQRTGALSNPAREVMPVCAPSLDGIASRAVWRFWEEPERRTLFGNSAREIAFFLFKWMIFAFLLESLMVSYMPTAWVGGWLGEQSRMAIPLAALIGIPSYLNGYAAIPTVAGLIELGMSPAAALAFMTAGGVTSIPALLSVYPLVKRPVFILYLLIALGGALAVGFTFAAF